MDAEDGTIRVELEQLFKHNPGARGKAEYVNGVPGRVLLGNTGKYLEFDKPEFFKWLKIDQPKSFAERVRDWLK